ncbi:hypothetical protein NE237_026729 [Protea cynaroides]|uniref:Uncharacterized protein n=1 Tax=Protea cynaroides TaxID=273540 RepID=A0A9Q0JTB7_9MAGN|nr:hypothetical protein NE237_026729 [Protea cynaroides]
MAKLVGRSASVYLPPNSLAFPEGRFLAAAFSCPFNLVDELSIPILIGIILKRSCNWRCPIHFSTTCGSSMFYVGETDLYFPVLKKRLSAPKERKWKLMELERK